MNKKGDYKWGIVLSLILGLMVLSLSMYFIFNEYFTDDDLDMEVCRQSIQVRATLPDATIKGIFTAESFKDSFPLKCKTMVKTIEKEDVEKDDASGAKIIIAESVAECWDIYQRGDSTAFPSKFYGLKSSCVPCVRIHLSEEARKYMEKEGFNIDIRGALDLNMEKDFRFYNFLENSGRKFSAFNPAFGMAFNLEGNFFFVNEDDKQDVTLKNKLTGGVKDEGWFDSFSKGILDLKMAQVVLPQFFYHDKGDLLINYGIITSSADEGIGNYIPYLFYFQTGQTTPNPFSEVKKGFLDGFTKSSNFCDGWEGIPA